MKALAIRLLQYCFNARRDLLTYACLLVLAFTPVTIKFLREPDAITKRSFGVYLCYMAAAWATTTYAFLYQRAGEDPKQDAPK